MRRIISRLCLVALLPLAFSCTDRMSVLKVYNWSDYIDEDILDEFEEWYKEETGKDVEVIYQTFDINETMLSKIERGQEDYDVVCPSDYIIERMLKNDLIIPIDHDFGDTPDYISQYVSPFIHDFFNSIDGGGKNANDYAVCYMWGTCGILYNTAYVSDEDALTWNILRNEKYKGRIFVKDAPRDVFSPVLIYLKQDELRDSLVTMQELMYDDSDESIAAVEAFMSEVKPLVAGWEADFGKEQMTQEKGYVNLTWSGDAVWAIEEAADVDVDLKYVVPEEGGNIWFDGWVIPKYAKNIDAARYFINFLCRDDIAIRNMDATGYVSGMASDLILETMQNEDQEEIVDASYFFGEQARESKLDPVLYADITTIERCALEHDWGENTVKLLEMWSRVKGNNANLRTYTVLTVTVLLIAFFTFWDKYSKAQRKKRRRQYMLAAKRSASVHK